MEHQPFFIAFPDLGATYNPHVPVKVWRRVVHKVACTCVDQEAAQVWEARRAGIGK